MKYFLSFHYSSVSSLIILCQLYFFQEFCSIFCWIIRTLIWSKFYSSEVWFGWVRFPILVLRGRDPPDAMSLCYADMSLPELLGRQSLHYADQASVMKDFFCRCGIIVFYYRLSYLLYCHDIKHIWTQKVIYKIHNKILNISYAKKKIFGVLFLE